MSAEWTPVVQSVSGVPEIEPEWVASNLGEVQIVDVREPAEFDGPLGHIVGAVLIPLGTLQSRIGEIAADKPVIAVCRSGARSAQATLFLQSAGCKRVANMTGGMLRWRGEGR